MNDEKTAPEENGETHSENVNSPKTIWRSLSAVAIVAVLAWAAYYFTNTNHAPKAARANTTRADQQVQRFEGLAKIQQAATNELEQAQEGQKVAQAAVQTQQALVEKAKLDLDYATISSPIDPTTASAVVRAKVPNPEHTLRPGQFVNVEVSGNKRTKVVTIPKIAVNQNPTGAMVYVLDDKGTAAPRPVELGDWAGDDWIINSGLKEGDRVIVDHLMQIRPGAPVTAAETASQPPAKSNQEN